MQQILNDKLAALQSCQDGTRTSNGTTPRHDRPSVDAFEGIDLPNKRVRKSVANRTPPARSGGSKKHEPAQ